MYIIILSTMDETKYCIVHIKKRLKRKLNITITKMHNNIFSQYAGYTGQGSYKH